MELLYIVFLLLIWVELGRSTPLIQPCGLWIDPQDCGELRSNVISQVTTVPSLLPMFLRSKSGDNGEDMIMYGFCARSCSLSHTAYYCLIGTS
jgi:hypothetical protein